MLTPVENPSAYGLVETDQQSNILRFLEKPKPEEITTNHINAGIYVLEPDTFDRIPSDVAWSVERSYFPSLIERGETFVAYVYNGYWIDIGTPEKYTQVHRDIMDGRYNAGPFRELGAGRAMDVAGCENRRGRDGGRSVLHRRRRAGQTGRPCRALLRHRAPDPGGRARVDRRRDHLAELPRRRARRRRQQRSSVATVTSAVT